MQVFQVTSNGRFRCVNGVSQISQRDKPSLTNEIEQFLAAFLNKH